MINLDKNKRYVVACSFGPDSMALLDMLIKQKFDLVVAHVNYHKRDVSNYEEEQLTKYCLDRNIPIEVLDTSNLKCDKNFQEWAREVRYLFFKDVALKHNASAVLVAHQQDDLIETFLMQKDRGGIVKYWGIAEKTKILGVEIIRPLLSYSKADLLKYDQDNNVPFSIDVSNLSNDYKRNQIRHEIVEKLDDKKRKEIIIEIEQKNHNVPKELNDIVDIDTFLSLSNEKLIRFISGHLEQSNLHTDISFKFLDEIRIAFKSKKAFIKIHLINGIYLCKDYDLIHFSDHKFAKSYSYKIDKLTKVNDELFTIDFSNGDYERNIKEDSYPLVIKPISPKDTYQINDYLVDVRRLFIDWKLPHCYRNCWPGIYDCHNKLIYIPRYRKTYSDNHKSIFVIKFTKH